MIQDLGFVRADGETLIGQPHLHRGEGGPRQWTLSDIRRHNLVLESPNIRVAREMGLPTGDHSGLATGDGSVALELAQAIL